MSYRIDKYSRYQAGIKLIDFAPNAMSNICACGCGVKLTGKKTRWASAKCSSKAYAEFSIIKGNTSAMRKAIFSIDKGYCRVCGAYDNKWQADHILPVAYGGGACQINNLQTLCIQCHNEKTQNQMVSHRAPKRFST